jgi:hexosaminidase
MPHISALQITLGTPDETLYFNISESYTLDINSERGGSYWVISLKADNCFGAIRGLETLSQLLKEDDENNKLYMTHLPIHIEDYPRFPYRGLLLDTARHFLPLPNIMELLETMSWVKMNILHWHMTDIESFPMQLVSHPLLSEEGSFSCTNSTYSPADIIAISRYARDLGILIVPELDMPAHSASWGRAYPELLARPCNYATNETSPNNVIDPANSFVYKVLEDVFRELHSYVDVAGESPVLREHEEERAKACPQMEIVPMEFIHLGADEVNPACWSDRGYLTKVANFTRENGRDLFSYFMNRQFHLAGRLKKRPIIWEDPFVPNTSFPCEVVIEAWKGWTGRNAFLEAVCINLVNVYVKKQN